LTSPGFIALWCIIGIIVGGFIGAVLYVLFTRRDPAVMKTAEDGEVHARQIELVTENHLHQAINVHPDQTSNEEELDSARPEDTDVIAVDDDPNDQSEFQSVEAPVYVTPEMTKKTSSRKSSSPRTKNAPDNNNNSVPWR
jgi:hypothetical protein